MGDYATNTCKFGDEDGLNPRQENPFSMLCFTPLPMSTSK
jgi:hypothetical protein